MTNNIFTALYAAIMSVVGTWKLEASGINKKDLETIKVCLYKGGYSKEEVRNFLQTHMEYDPRWGFIFNW